MESDSERSDSEIDLGELLDEDTSMSGISVFLKKCNGYERITEEETNRFLEANLSTLTQTDINLLLKRSLQNISSIKMVIDAGFDIRGNDDDFFIECCRGYYNNDLVIFLLDECHCNPNAQGSRAMVMAGDSENLKVIQTLIDHGCKIPIEAIDDAIEYTYYDIINLFLKNEYDPNIIFRQMLKRMRIGENDGSIHLFKVLNKFNPNYEKVINDIKDDVNDDVNDDDDDDDN